MKGSIQGYWSRRIDESITKGQSPGIGIRGSAASKADL
ncbi:MAG: type II toxin-antitoxin system YoeB family toxin [Lachnospiraceae bacterium]|nr:type II toxin-antitoxin system YoeB family toxin [Lachnospiraceae bacterium]